MRADLHKLEQQLKMIRGVNHVESDDRVPGELRLKVGLTEFEWDVRRSVIELVDDFAREHVQEATVTVDVLAGPTAE